MSSSSDSRLMSSLARALLQYPESAQKAASWLLIPYRFHSLIERKTIKTDLTTLELPEFEDTVYGDVGGYLGCSSTPLKGTWSDDLGTSGNGAIR